MSDPTNPWHDVASTHQVPPGAAIEVVAGGVVVALTNVEGQITALDGICAHQGGPLGKGELTGDCLTCPWHGWQYDARTGRQLLSSTIAQRRFATRVEADRIWVCVD